MSAGAGEHVAALERVVSACRVELPATVVWFGARSTAVPRGLLPVLDGEDLRLALHAALRDRVYSDAYCVGGAQPTPPRERGGSLGADRRVLERLREANTGRGSWAPGWRVRDVRGDLLAVASGGLQLWVAPHECRPAGAAVGDEVAVRMPEGSAELSPGYYCAFSDAPMPEGSALVRLYLALRPVAAPAAVRATTGALNAAGAPFRLKVLTDPQHYRRRDAAVLYLPVGAVAAATGALPAALAALDGGLVPGAPLLTRRLAPGVALAEEPRSRDSFGEHRSGLVAEGLLRAAERGATAPAERLDAVLEALEAGGVRLEAPHLEPGSDDAAYDGLADAVASAVPAAATAAVPTAAHRAAPPRPRDHAADPAAAPAAPSHAPARLEEVPRELARRLVAGAVWHEDRCTWTGIAPTTDDRGRPVLAAGSVGRALYDGSAGIALFLAAAGRLLDDEDAAATARAAARHALRPSPASPGTPPGGAGTAGAAEPAGLHLGGTGRALAAGAVGVLARDAELVAAAVGAAERCGPAEGWDHLSGDAGAVLGLLALARLAGAPHLLDAATRCGERLLAAARRGRRGLSWPQPGGGRAPGLTGLSHGASGAAAALVELAAATGEERWADAAREALRYERSLFDPTEGNWPDLRDAGPRGARPFRVQWCHGAPGIALVRLRAAEVLGDAELRAEAATALRTTARGTLAALGSGELGHSLCHGLLGNTDALLEGLPETQPPEPPDRPERPGPPGVLGPEDAAAARAVVDLVAATALARHTGPSREPWQCGVPVPGEEVPGLMIGLAGIGWAFLRRARPGALPCLLLVRPDDVARLAALADRRPSPDPATAGGAR